MFRITLERAIFLAVVAVLSLIVFSFSPNAEAALGINAQIPFYGVLNDDKGKPLTGTYGMVFRIYDAPTGGTVLWTGTYTGVSVSDGEFSVMLGSGTGNEFALDWNDDSYYLGVAVGTDSEMVPRERLGASPYAMNAGRLGGLVASDFLKAGSLLSVTSNTTTPLLSLSQFGLGNFISLYDASSAEVFSVLNTGEVIGTKFQSTLIDEMNTFAGSLEVLGGEQSVFDAGMRANNDIVLSDGSGIAFGGDNGLRVYQDLFNFTPSGGTNNLVIEPRGEAVSAHVVNILTPVSLGLFANVGGDGLNMSKHALMLNEDGSTELYNRGIGDPDDQVFYIDFESGVQIMNGNLDVVAGDMTISGTDSLGYASLFVSGSGGLRVDNLAADSGTVSLEADTQGNIMPAPSDEHLKQNIRTIDDALDTLLSLRGVRYEWRDTERFGTQTEVGFVAQELQDELPEVVRDTGEYLSVNTKNITAVVVEAVKEMYGEMQEYFSRTEQLEREVELLRQEIEALKGDPQVNTSAELEVEITTTEPETQEEAPLPAEEVIGEENTTEEIFPTEADTVEVI